MVLMVMQWDARQKYRPRTRRGDMSNDVVTYTADRFITLDNKIAELPEIYNDEGETKNDFTNSFYSLVVIKADLWILLQAK